MRLLLLALITGVAVQRLGPPGLQAVLCGLKLDGAGAVCSLLVALAAAVLIHEGGHCCAAILMNFAVTGFSFGPLRVTYLQGRWNWRFAMKTVASASVSAVPRRMENWRRRILLIIAAGPVATLLSGILAGVLFCALPGDAGAKNFLVGLAQVSFYIFLLGLIPNHSQARVRNDARLFLTIARNGPDAREIYLYNWIEQQRYAGRRPSALPAELIQRLARAAGRPDFSALFAHMLAENAADRGDLDEAERWYREACVRCRGGDPRTVSAAHAHLACFLLILRGDVAEAAQVLEQVQFALLSPPGFAFRVAAVAAFAAGRPGAALEAIAQARSAICSQSPLCQWERMLLGRLQAITCSTRFLHKPGNPAVFNASA